MSRQFLLTRERYVHTNPFDLDSREWLDQYSLTTCLKTVDIFRSVQIWHRFDGNLGAYLWNEGVTRATAHFCFTIVNEEHDKSVSAGVVWIHREIVVIPKLVCSRKLRGDFSSCVQGQFRVRPLPCC